MIDRLDQVYSGLTELEREVSTPSVLDLPGKKINIKDLLTHESSRDQEIPNILVNTFSADRPVETESKNHENSKLRVGANKKYSLALNPMNIEDKLLPPIEESDSSSKNLSQPSLVNGQSILSLLDDEFLEESLEKSKDRHPEKTLQVPVKDKADNRDTVLDDQDLLDIENE